MKMVLLLVKTKRKVTFLAQVVTKKLKNVIQKVITVLSREILLMFHMSEVWFDWKLQYDPINTRYL